MSNRGPDLLVRTAPPLSATADEPLMSVEAPPVSASADPKDLERGVPAEITPEAKAVIAAAKKGGDDPEKPEVKAEEPAVDPADPDAAEVPQGSTPTQAKAFIKMRRQAREQVQAAQKAAQEAKESADVALREIAELRAKAESPKVEEALPRPTRDQFDTPDSYDDALTAWATKNAEREIGLRADQARKATEKAAQENAAKAQKEAQEAELTAIHATWNDRRTKAMDKYPDFANVAESDAVKISDPMAAVIIRAENGPDIAYYLGKNPEVAERIAAQKTVAEQIYEMGMLAGKLQSTPTPRAARAKPIEPLNGNIAAADTSDREPSMAEYAARREAELNKRRAAH